ncbi:hypothetical protein E3_0130 [Rhodococcus phage E3]|uniref:hypothetical protein n=1 Tax=Rhodococcus phage E3 TaxID=1007869 RepID=UPI0002C6A050|nr:hypothetical protein M176_gp013 [Rhodococcus phage E3]AEQ20923.1 hypothetical protein E3_0130 [Rhodococcus phage E3]
MDVIVIRQQYVEEADVYRHEGLHTQEAATKTIQRHFPGADVRSVTDGVFHHDGITYLYDLTYVKE